MSELRQNGTRFRVVECEGYSMNPSGVTAGNAHVGLSVAVLDSAFAWREVAVFQSERQGAWGVRRNAKGHLMPREPGELKPDRFEIARRRAAELADELNLQDRLAS